MQYLLIDAHKRFLGTLNSQETLAVGDVFQSHNEQTYAVVGLNWSAQRNSQTQSLTVIPVGARSSKADEN
ncbi:MAG TPA: hypothetical protein V6C78_33695 [Crinalium sp.]|jgi:hypothetical protein